MGVVQVVQGRAPRRSANFSMFERRLALLEAGQTRPEHRVVRQRGEARIEDLVVARALALLEHGRLEHRRDGGAADAGPQRPRMDQACLESLTRVGHVPLPSA